MFLIIYLETILSMFNFTCDLLYEYDANWSEPLNGKISLGNAYKWSYLISYFIDENIIGINDRN